MTPLRYAVRSPMPGRMRDLNPGGAPVLRPGSNADNRLVRAGLSARPRPPVPRGRRGWLIETTRELARLRDEARWQRNRHGLSAAYALLGKVACGTTLRHAAAAR